LKLVKVLQSYGPYKMTTCWPDLDPTARRKYFTEVSFGI